VGAARGGGGQVLRFGESRQEWFELASNSAQRGTAIEEFALTTNVKRRSTISPRLTKTNSKGVTPCRASRWSCSYSLRWKDRSDAFGDS